MNRALTLALALTAALPSYAVTAGKQWSLTSCGTCAAGMQCQMGKCAPLYKIAATVENDGHTNVINGAEGVPYSTVIARTQDAFAAWTGSRVTACSTAWNVVYGGTYTSPQSVNAMSGSDSQNLVMWETTWRYSSTTLALTTTTFFTGTGQIFDADMEMNDLIEWGDRGGAGVYDYQSVIVHEVGHFLGLEHTPANASAVMFPYVNPGAQKRTLAGSDTDDVCTLYPVVTGAQGTACTQGSDCTGGRVCEGVAGGTGKICTQDCASASGTCPPSYSCQASTVGFACLLTPGAPDLCHFCSSGSDCSSGVCVTDGLGTNWCSLACTTDAQCGANYKCESTAQGGFCVPVTKCTNQCTTAAQCATGYTCTTGTCTPTGNKGDRCEVSGVCKSCLVCVSDPTNPNLAFCDPCCGGQSSDGFCMGCAPATCATGSTCAGLANGKDSVCIAAGGTAFCQTCGAGMPCASGFQCVGGKCHASCNPSSPGTCAACSATGGGEGVCACSDEVRGPGEGCGSTSTTLGVCATGLTCVGSPGVCRVNCSSGDVNACPAGSSCQNTGSSSVCIPSGNGEVCAACNNGQCGGALATCYSNRCYVSCNVNTSGRCSTCVQIDAVCNGVCACSDQIVGEGSDCGIPSVQSCQSGLLCISGKCRGQCDPSRFTCPALTDCLPYAGATYCVPIDTGTGGGDNAGGGAGGGGGKLVIGQGGGAGGGMVDDKGCASCGGGATAAFLTWPMGLLLLASRRRR